jgi:hypothetical protein
VKLRLHGIPADLDQATGRLVELLDVVSVSGPCPDRGPSVLVRVGLEVRLDLPNSTKPAPLAGLAQRRGVLGCGW